MKKILSILMALALCVTLVGAALAESTAAGDDFESFPQPEGGKKFEGNWAIAGGLVQIVYEEEGYRVAIQFPNVVDLKGETYAYNCYYNAEQDRLEAISAAKHVYTIDPETNDELPAEGGYDLFAAEDMDVSFSIDANGKLIWNDSVENAGADLEFVNIGRFEGQWMSEGEEDLWAEIMWNGLDEEEFFYTVFIHRGPVEFLMNGFYNAETGKLECMGTATQWVENAEGGFDPVEDGETYEAFFSMLENGNLLFEAANGIEMVPGMPNG